MEEIDPEQKEKKEKEYKSDQKSRGIISYSISIYLNISLFSRVSYASDSLDILSLTSILIVLVNDS